MEPLLFCECYACDGSLYSQRGMVKKSLFEKK